MRAALCITAKLDLRLLNWVRLSLRAMSASRPPYLRQRPNGGHHSTSVRGQRRSFSDVRVMSALLPGKTIDLCPTLFARVTVRTLSAPHPTLAGLAPLAMTCGTLELRRRGHHG